jgi:F0F1-type ATP synthase assembly protein I
VAAFVPAIRLGALLAASAFLGGLVVGRVVSLVRDGIPGPMPLALVLVELMGVLLTLGAVLKRRAPAIEPLPAPSVPPSPAPS